MKVLKKLVTSIFLLCGIAHAPAQSLPPIPQAQAPEPIAYQYSTIDALLAGAYDGDLNVTQLKSHGDFGIGTYNRIDGEMILVDGAAYKVKADGTVVVAGANEKTPFAIATSFASNYEQTITVSTSLKELEEQLDKQLPNKNLFYAIRVEGNFKQVTTRAISPQNKPYKPLAEVSKTQSVFNLTDTSGVLVAFRSPAFSKGINVPGWHWHYLSYDKKSGGHVLGLTLGNGIVKIMPLSNIQVKIPTNEMFANTDQAVDRSVELKSVEGERKN
jgi:acetolactate decarboxylase